MKILKTKHNQILLLLQFLFCFFIINNTIAGFFIPSLVFIVINSFLLFIKGIKKRIDIIDFYFIFISFYVVFGLLLFNHYTFQETFLKISLLPFIIPVEQELFNINIVYAISLLVFSIILFDVKSDFRVKNKIETNKSNKIFFIVIIILTAILGVISYKYKDASYIQYLRNATWYEKGLVSYSFLILLSIISCLNLKYPYNKKILHSFFCLLPIMFILSLGNRIFVLVLLFALLLNLQKRGLKIGLGQIAGGSILMVLVLLVAVKRNGVSVSFEYNVFTALMEFIAPNISAHYFINNPLGFNSLFPSSIDFFTQLLPERLVPLNNIENMRSFYKSNGIEIDPIGGQFLFGQLFFYFRSFAFVVLLLFSVFILKMKRKLLFNTISSIEIVLPLILMYSSRFYIVGIPRNILYSLFLFFIIKSVIESIRKPDLNI